MSFGPISTDPLTDQGLWVPERLWARLRLVAGAYELRLLPILDGTSDPVFLNAVQVSTLLEELRFIGQILSDPLVDPLVEALVRALVDLAAERSQGASKDWIGIEFP
ncbi:MAG: hypothetical protein ACKVWR_09495 [Acidimicrobiales bacterium]